jgi:hypothetical protein
MAHHKPFKALEAVGSEAVLSHENDGSLHSVLEATFKDAQTLADSIPSSSSGNNRNEKDDNGTGRPRSGHRLGRRPNELPTSPR